MAWPKKIKIKKKGWYNAVWASQMVLLVKNVPGSAGDTSDVSSVRGSGRSLEEGMATHSSILAWIIPWTEELGGLQSTEFQI